MGKEEKIVVEGIVKEALPGTQFRVELERHENDEIVERGVKIFEEASRHVYATDLFGIARRRLITVLEVKVLWNLLSRGARHLVLERLE